MAGGNWQAPMPAANSPETCDGRFFYVARVATRKWDTVGEHLPWWMRKHGDEHVRTLTKPVQWEVFTMGICAPEPCTVVMAAKWIAPHFNGVWGYPAHSIRDFNETHVVLPPALSEPRSYPLYESTWIAERPQPPGGGARKADQVQVFEFMLLEHPRAFGLNLQNCLAFLAIVTLPLLAGAADMVGGEKSCRARQGLYSCVLDAFSPQRSMSRLLTPRGPTAFELCRICFTMVVVLCHSYVLGGWKSAPEETAFARFRGCIKVLPRANTGFVVLSVYLGLRRWQCPSSTQGSSWWRLFVRWLVVVAWHAVRRIAVVGSLTAFWTFVYLRVYVEDAPFHLRFKFEELTTILGHRCTCGSPAHLTASLLLAHGFVFMKRTRCLGVAIFECLVQINVAVFALAAFIGVCGRRLCVAAILLWPAAVLLSTAEDGGRSSGAGATIAADGSGASSLTLLGTAHTFRRQWQAALAATSLCAAFPAGYCHGTLFAGAKIVTAAFAAALLLTTTALDLICTVGAGASGGTAGTYGSSDWFVALRAWFEARHDGWSHVCELPHVVGLVLLLRFFGDGRDFGPSSNMRTANERMETSTPVAATGDVAPATAIMAVPASTTVSPVETASKCMKVGSALAGAVGRLCGGVNISHQFVLVFVMGNLLRERLEPSMVGLFVHALALLVVSLPISLLVYLAVEAPCARLVEFCGPRPVGIGACDDKEHAHHE
eukprot:TRINITY_DN63333_c0_g1_i1.p1 TRINITY_DN63333_c0_g1~~TRINITY_DN63333_c0_g1_i1.p1  ORF type:complete len:833 (-),score=97.14 TRINITY_DN63333_c0_g1_i1:170-2317(-)